MSVYQKDLEDVLNAIYDVFVRDYNDILLQVQNAKNDGLVLSPVESFFKGVYDVQPNNDPFLVFDIRADEFEDIGITTKLGFKSRVWLYKSDTNDDKFMPTILRYQKAMLKTVEKNFDQLKMTGCIGVSAMGEYFFDSAGNRLPLIPMFLEISGFLG